MDLTSRIFGVESAGNNNARNPRSSATGPAQFIDSTWMDMINRYRPDLAALPRDQVLGMRTDPNLSREMTQHYADENGSRLSAAGLPDNDGTRYLAHVTGPAGAQAVLSADPSTPVSQILGPAVMAANPNFDGMTAGGMASWAAKKVGGDAPAMRMPDASSTQSQAPGAFGLSGPVPAGTDGSVMPAGGAAMQAPGATQLAGMNAADFFARIMRQGQQMGQPAVQAQQPEQPSLMSRLMAQQQPSQPAPAFDAQRFYALLQGRR